MPNFDSLFDSRDDDQDRDAHDYSHDDVLKVLDNDWELEEI